jgi:MSHA pilin protein MshA
VSTKIQQRGFTLIELVVVITILGILAAFAVPRFASLEGSARTAATQALAGSIRSSASLAHALWLANGDPNSNSVTMEGQAIAMTFGYPTAAATGIDLTLVEFAGFSVSTVSGARIFTKTAPNGTTAINNCQVSYTPPAAANGAPSVQATTSGCQ